MPINDRRASVLREMFTRKLQMWWGTHVDVREPVEELMALVDQAHSVLHKRMSTEEKRERNRALARASYARRRGAFIKRLRSVRLGELHPEIE